MSRARYRAAAADSTSSFRKGRGERSDKGRMLDTLRGSERGAVGMWSPSDIGQRATETATTRETA